MKKQYNTPKIEILEIETEDVIAASGNNGKPGGHHGHGPGHPCRHCNPEKWKINNDFNPRTVR